MDERLKFIARLLDGEKMAVLCRQVRGLHVTAKIAAVDFRDDALASKLAAFHFFGHCLAKLMEQYERGLIG